jgi:uncharacterized OB-fold protein
VKGPGADEHYWRALQEGRLDMQQCNGCMRWNWPAVWRCGECGSWEHSWHAVPLTGRIYSWTRTWHDFGAPAEFVPPFVSVLVELDGAGQRRLLGTLPGDYMGDVWIGAAVSGAIISIQVDGQPLPALRWTINPGQQAPIAQREGATA